MRINIRRELHEVTGRGEDRSFDYLGTLTFLVGLTGLVYGISKGGIEGWTSPLVIPALILAVVFLPLFTLQGVEGKLFSPMAFVISALP